ncbi:hypothetical protein ScPMuIL_002747 [Solemya velum]
MFLVVIAAVIALTTARLPFREELNGEWESYKTTHNKHYHENEFQRRIIWESNIQKIQRHNLEADRGLHTYTLGMNKYGDLTSEEFRQLNGFNTSLRSAVVETFLPPSHVTSLPSTVDWRKEGYVTPIKDQGQCGSCWAFAAVASLEGQHFKKEGELVSLSEQNLVDCSRAQGNDGCEGGLPDQAYEYIKVNDGVDTESSYPYKARDDKCHFVKADVGATDTGYVDITKGSEGDLKTAAATVGPISVGIDASHDSFQLYRSGVYNERRCSKTQLDHGVTVVGYGTHEGNDYWLVKNSWGTSWGEDGYIMMSRNKDNQCGIATAASYPRV